MNLERIIFKINFVTHDDYKTTVDPVLLCILLNITKYEPIIKHPPSNVEKQNYLINKL